MTDPVVAVLYQALPPPVLDGLRKDAKPGGYSDSGADIAAALAARGVTIACPVPTPDPTRALDWVFPDTRSGIRAAIDAGATIIWANTVLFAGHPLELVTPEVAIVGQLPAATQRFDDKFLTNRILSDAGLPIPRSLLVAPELRPGMFALATIGQTLTDAGLSFPLIVKPVRGRGSQGVTLVHDLAGLNAAAGTLIAAATFGDVLMVEAYLGGEELTVTVMPPASPRPSGTTGHSHWSLRPVRRFAQRGGVAPYNGDVPVTANSAAIGTARLKTPAVRAMLDACIRAAVIVDARAPIRIDCRADATGTFHLFDLNMKPNLTGPGRPGRDDQDCLSAIAARAEGWAYADLLTAMLAACWTTGGRQP